MRHNNSRGQAGPARVSPSETQCSAAGSVLQSRRRRWPMPRMLIFVIVVGNSRFRLQVLPGTETNAATRLEWIGRSLTCMAGYFCSAFSSHACLGSLQNYWPRTPTTPKKPPSTQTSTREPPRSRHRTCMHDTKTK
jgi:hypothetical protein